MKLKIKVVLMMLPLILLILVSGSFALNEKELQATLTISPSAKVDCKPDVITIGSNLKWINCFIEIDNVDVSHIDISTVKLSAQDKSGYVNADPTFSNLGDFDSDGKTDLQVRFSKSSADQTIFSGISSTTSLTLIVTGTVDQSQFSGTDGVLLVKSSPYEVARYFQVTSENVKKAKIKTIESVDLSKYSPSKTTFTGYFVSSGDPKIIGNSGLYSEGYLFIPRTVSFLGVHFTVYSREKVTIGAYFTKYDDCSADKTTFEIHCQGSGLLLVRNHLKEITFRDNIPTMRVDIKDYKVNLEGGKIWNDIISVSDIKINKIMIR